MKNAVIILGIFCAMLLTSQYLNRGKARRLTEESAKETLTLSNKLAEVQTRLVMNQALAADAQTNLQSQLEKRAREITAFSNRYTAASQTIASTRKEAQTTRAELEAKSARLAEVEWERDELKHRIDQLKFLEQSQAELRSNLAAATAQRDVAIQEAQRWQLAKSDLDNKFNDTNALRFQLKKLEDQAKLNRRVAQGMPLSQYNRLTTLILEPDGSVKPVPVEPALGENKKTTTGKTQGPRSH
jgi:uncharacterized protein involved in exopolysaccharide biosynthesis